MLKLNNFNFTSIDNGIVGRVPLMTPSPLLFKTVFVDYSEISAMNFLELNKF